jgi:hypothetical protein
MPSLLISNMEWSGPAIEIGYGNAGHIHQRPGRALSAILPGSAERVMKSETNFEILLRVSHLARLFHSLDPSPFRERDLDAEAEDYIISWAQDAPHDTAFDIIVELPRSEIGPETGEVVAEAVRNNFEYKIGSKTRELLREGRHTLLVGMAVLATSLTTNRIIAGLAPPGAFGRTMSESLLILGWAANWRPPRSSSTAGGRSYVGEVSTGAWSPPISNFGWHARNRDY